MQIGRVRNVRVQFNHRLETNTSKFIIPLCTRSITNRICVLQNLFLLPLPTLGQISFGLIRRVDRFSHPGDHHDGMNKIPVFRNNGIFSFIVVCADDEESTGSKYTSCFIDHLRYIRDVMQRDETGDQVDRMIREMNGKDLLKRISWARTLTDPNLILAFVDRCERQSRMLGIKDLSSEDLMLLQFQTSPNRSIYLVVPTINVRIGPNRIAYRSILKFGS